MHPELEARLLHCRNLPSPPAVALRIIELAQDPGADLNATARVIGMDPALSARMLRVANSPLYAGRRRVDNLGQALTLLGLNATLSLALGFSLAPGLRGDPGSASEQERIWRRSVLAALAARLLGGHARLPRLEDLMLAGLLQDIGALALLQAMPDEYAEVRARTASRNDLLANERAAFGADHAETGAWLARYWQLPGYLAEAIGASESPGNGNPLHACIAAAGIVADLWLDGGDDPGLREIADGCVRDCAVDGTTLDQLLAQLAASLPEIGAVFDVISTFLPNATMLERSGSSSCFLKALLPAASMMPSSS